MVAIRKLTQISEPDLKIGSVPIGMFWVEQFIGKRPLGQVPAQKFGFPFTSYLFKIPLLRLGGHSWGTRGMSSGATRP